MVDKVEVAVFIIEKQKVSWTDLEKQFVSFPSGFSADNKCLKCNSPNVYEHLQASLVVGVEPEKTGYFRCENCGAVILQNEWRIARQTLLNFTKALIKERIIDKVIDKETLRPVYVASPTGEAKLEDLKVRKKLHSLIDRAENIRETLQQLKKYIIEEEKT